MTTEQAMAEWLASEAYARCEQFTAHCSDDVREGLRALMLFAWADGAQTATRCVRDALKDAMP